MIERPPSTLRDYDLIWAQDTALKLEDLPDFEGPVEGESAAELAARKETWKAAVDKVSGENLARYVKAALETGDWSELVIPGQVPTVFRIRQVPGAVWDALEDWKINDRASQASYFTAVFRAGVVAIKDGPPTIKCEFDEHRSTKTGDRTGIGKVLKASVTDALHAIHKRIVPDIATFIAQQRGGPAGKS